MQATDTLLARITIDARILAGKPTIRGLRISVQQILKALAAGQTPDELIDDLTQFSAGLGTKVDAAVGHRRA